MKKLINIKQFYCNCSIKAQQKTQKKGKKSFIFAISVLLGGMLFSDLQANPTGGVVQNGQAVISNAAANKVVIQQNSQKVIINWDSFNIKAGEHTHFQQPLSGVALNRISPAQGASSIYGHLSATGQIILINPAGIYFGPGSYVNVGGMVATTSNLSSENFLNNKYYFEGAGPGQIINHGTIIAANHGLIALVGNQVENNGMIRAHLGKVVLGSAEAFTVGFGPDNLIHFVVNQSAKSPTKVSNHGQIYADGGKVLMTSASASSILDHAINMDGVIQANSVSVKKGEIIFTGGDVKISGKIYAKGEKANESGGSVKVYSKQLALNENAVIDVSGNANGGQLILGNKDQDVGLGLFNEKTTIDKNALLLANSQVSGNGGLVQVWSDGQTDYFGKIESRGGVQQGDGGFVEVSGKEYLNFQGLVDTSAANGSMGTLLLDPKFIVISTLGITYLDNVNNRFGNSASGTSTLTPAGITTVSALSNIILQANSDVIFNDALALVGTATLTVQAGRSILINASISTNNAAIIMTANDSSATSAQRSTTTSGNPSGDAETTNGNITMAAGTTLNAGTGSITLTVADTGANPFTAGNATLRGLTGSTINVTSANAITVNGAITGTNATLVAKNGGITLNSTITTSGSNYSLKLAGTSFTNNVGASALTATNGNFQVWSGSPLTDTRNGIVYDFKQYNATYGVTSVLGSGNGFLYTLAPTVTPVLTGSVSKVYDATTSAVLAANNYTYTGTIDGDVATITTPVSGSYDNKNVGTNKNVSVTGINLTGATNGSASVYGYAVTSTANANIGEITVASLITSLTRK
jgi:filamentous hemagglutinin family protein